MDSYPHFKNCPMCDNARPNAHKNGFINCEWCEVPHHQDCWKRFGSCRVCGHLSYIRKNNTHNSNRNSNPRNKGSNHRSRNNNSKLKNNKSY